MIRHFFGGRSSTPGTAALPVGGVPATGNQVPGGQVPVAVNGTRTTRTGVHVLNSRRSGQPKDKEEARPFLNAGSGSGPAIMTANADSAAQASIMAIESYSKFNQTKRKYKVLYVSSFRCNVSAGSSQGQSDSTKSAFIENSSWKSQPEAVKSCPPEIINNHDNLQPFYIKKVAQEILDEKATNGLSKTESTNKTRKYKSRRQSKKAKNFLTNGSSKCEEFELQPIDKC